MKKLLRSFTITAAFAAVLLWGCLLTASYAPNVWGQITPYNPFTTVTSLTANGVVYGNGIGPVQATAQGAANSILTANAGAPSFSQTPTINTSLTLGVASSQNGSLLFKQSGGSGTFTIQPSASMAGSSQTWTLPSAGNPFTQSYLTTSGSGGALVWQNAAGALIGVASASSGTSVDISLGNTATNGYQSYVITIDNARIAAATANLTMRVSTDNCSTAVATGTYFSNQVLVDAAGAVTGTASNTGTSWPIGTLDTTAKGSGRIILRIAGTSSTNVLADYESPAGPTMAHTMGHQASTSVNCVRFLTSASTFSAINLTVTGRNE